MLHLRKGAWFLMGRITAFGQAGKVVLIGLLVFAVSAPIFKVQAQSSLISLNKPAVALSTEDGSDPSLVNDADGSNNSHWASYMGAFQNTWVQIDLEGTFFIDRINVRNWVDGTRYYHYYIRGSLDGIHWYPIAGKSDDTPASESGDDHFVSTVARYVRVNVTYNSANQSAHISDLKVYGYPVAMSPAPPLAIEVATERGAYEAGGSVHLDVALRNKTTVPQTVAGVSAIVHGIDDPYYLREVELAANFIVAPGATATMNGMKAWDIPPDASNGAYGIFLKYTLANGEMWTDYQTFVRVTDDSELTVYQIDVHQYYGLDIFALDGGMSAEYAVQKAGEALSASVSHSWVTSAPGEGPNPVYATQEFLERSVQATVDFYNEQFGATTKFDTVIISTGVPSVPYVSRAMKAPVLPLQFLAAMSSVKELKAILDYSAAHGLSAYSTLGYDGSVTPGVAWLKLLDLPEAYKDFLNDHDVDHVVIMGSSGTFGESTAKELLDDGAVPGTVEPGDIFVMYPGGGTVYDIDQLTMKFRDLGEFQLEASYRLIADWESGVSPEQLTNFTASIQADTGVQAIDFVAGIDSLHLYEFASYVMLSFYKKNEAALSAEGPPVMGVALNPYLIAHPFYESKIRYVPFLFWQFGDVEYTVDVRLNQHLRDAIAHYFPEIDFDELHFWIGATHNFGRQLTADNYEARLIHNGLFHIEMNDYTADEVWDLSDGLNAPVEYAAHNLLTYSTPQQLKAWDASLQPLTLADLEAIPNVYPHISVTRQ